MNGFERFSASIWSFLVVTMLAFALSGCEGDDGTNGADGAAGAPGAPGSDGADGADGTSVSVIPLESCAVCHDDGSYVSAPAAHEIDREITYTVVTPPTADGDDLVVAFDMKVDGSPYNDFTLVQRAVIFQGINGDYTRNQLPNNSHAFLESVVDGVYTFRIPGGTLLNGVAVNPADFVGTDARVYFRLNSPPGVTPSRRASVSANDAAYARLDLVGNESCMNCHGEFAGGLTSHHYNPFEAENCIACHSAVNPPNDIGMAYLTHGIHNSHNMPGGVFDLQGEIFDVTYPTYTTNCSVCHAEPAQLTAANAMPVSGEGCFTCHGSMDSFTEWFKPDGGSGNNPDGLDLSIHFALTPTPDTADCSQCHNATGVAATKLVVTDSHNGLATGRSGLIWDGADVSVTEAEKFVWEITGIIDDGVNLAISWQASYEGVGVDPCNNTVGVGAPVFFLPGGGSGGTFSMLRSYAQGDDFILGQSTSAPGQAGSVNLTVANTVCAGAVATTTIPVDVTFAERGIVALQGKPGVVSPASATELLRVRVPTPTYEWLVGDGSPPLMARRNVVDTGKCLDCHVGSLYQHGGNRVDNVDMCVLCHNSASNEQSVRVGLGVDPSEAYDGKVGETFEMKTMLHRIHSAGTPGSPPYVIYRNRGIYAFAPDTSELPNWPGTGPQIVYGSTDDAVIDHNFHSATYPRAINDCAACHTPDFAVIPDQTQAMANTTDAGSTEWINQIDDTLQGAATTACITCHTDAATKGHAYQNSWAPQVFPEGRQTIIDSAR